MLQETEFIVKLHPHAKKGAFRITGDVDLIWLYSADRKRSESFHLTQLCRGGHEEGFVSDGIARFAGK
jgi:hypothetical protein